MLNAPEGYVEHLDLPEDVSVAQTPDGEFDLVQAFYTRAAELDKAVNILMSAMGSAGQLWVCYPKGTSKVPTGLNRDILLEFLRARGLQSVAMVAIYETWSAMRPKKI